MLTLSLIACSVSVSPDQEVVDRVEATLQNADLGTHEFEIASRNGNVTINGFVSTESDKRTVESFAKQVDGVKRLTSNLDIKESMASARIGESRNTCAQVSIPQLEHKGSITYECKGNTVTVTGSLGSISDRERVRETLARAMPSSRIIMDAEITDRPSDAVLQRTLESALAKEGRINDTVEFNVLDGVAYFKGTVTHHTEIDAMLSTANMIEGLRDVRSSVRIEN